MFFMGVRVGIANPKQLFLRNEEPPTMRLQRHTLTPISEVANGRVGIDEIISAAFTLFLVSSVSQTERWLGTYSSSKLDPVVCLGGGFFVEKGESEGCCHRPALDDMYSINDVRVTERLGERQRRPRTGKTKVVSHSDLTTENSSSVSWLSSVVRAMKSRQRKRL